MEDVRVPQESKPEKKFVVSGKDSFEIEPMRYAIVEAAASRSVDIHTGEGENTEVAFTVPQGATIGDIKGLYEKWLRGDSTEI